MNLIGTIKKTVLKEIKYVSSLYPFKIDRYFDDDLVYAKNIFSFPDILQKKTPVPHTRDHEGIAGLATGIEMLGIGLSLHIFDPAKSDEKKYILELLIGDIIYARAIIYLLKHGDFDLFKMILASLKESHKNRLKIHERIKKAKEEDQDSAFFTIKELIGDRSLTSGASSLLKTSYEIGWELFGDEDRDNKKTREIVEQIGRASASRMTIKEVGDYLAESGLPTALMDKISEAIGKSDKSLEKDISVLDAKARNA